MENQRQHTKIKKQKTREIKTNRTAIHANTRTSAKARKDNGKKKNKQTIDHHGKSLDSYRLCFCRS